ncbi:hypothetical protein [Saccharophagus degradans]|nr:hypothetical protein [Saccharophagus degradans]
MVNLYRALYSRLPSVGVSFFPLILFVIAGLLAFMFVDTSSQLALESKFVASTHVLLVLGSACLLALRQVTKKGS